MSYRSKARRARRKPKRTVLHVRVPLCDMCSKRDSETESDLQETWELMGREPFRHVWCGAIDGPEDLRWATCPMFEEMV